MKAAGWCTWLLLLCGLHAGPVAASALPPGTPPHALQPGEFVWLQEAAPAGPLLLVVSLVEQRAYLYRNGVRIAVSTVSSGKPGNETPAGVYTILQKHAQHFSNLYDGAPMPFMQRLTWDGIALHAGKLPGHPASHGCVRLPPEFARRLFGMSTMGMTVVVADESATTPQLVHPGWLAPPLPGPDGAPLRPDGAPVRAADPTETWAPELSPRGPMTIVIATADRSIRVLRNGVEIGAASFSLDGPAPAGVHVLQLQAAPLDSESAYVPGMPRLRWAYLHLDGQATGPAAPPSSDALYGRLQLSPTFARALYDALTPGDTVVVTDTALDPGQRGEPVLDSVAEPLPGT